MEGWDDLGDLLHTEMVYPARQHSVSDTNARAVLSQVEPRDAAVNFDTYQILQRHRAVYLP